VAPAPGASNWRDRAQSPRVDGQRHGERERGEDEIRPVRQRLARPEQAGADRDQDERERGK
jgi:hypothetical protein